MTGGTADHFSASAADYGRFRPGYPATLYDRLLARVERFDVALDCASGSGQALTPLAARFALTLATDTSQAQLAHLPRALAVLRVAASAECLPLRAASVDLVTVAQALHWFNLPRFFGEVRRVLRPRGVCAAWTYNLCRVSRAVDACVDHFYHEVVGAWWPVERRRVERAYADVAWPFAEVERWQDAMTLDWTREHLLAYIGTWSAVAAFRRAHGADPLPVLADALAPLWPAGEVRTVSWPLTVFAARQT